MLKLKRTSFLMSFLKHSWPEVASFSQWEKSLLLTEDVEGDHVNFSVTVLASLGSGHIDDLAGFALDHDEFTLSESRALLWVSKGSSGLSSFEFVIFVIRHGYLLNTIL